MAKRSERTRNLIVISDTHTGCKVGLVHPDGAKLDGGGFYKPSRFQKKMYGWFEEFFGEWVPKVTRGEPWDLVLNGDAVDGVHHRSTTQFSHNLVDQRRAAEKVLALPVRLCKDSGGKYYHIRGTEAHVGQSGEYEEQLAKDLGAMPNDDEQYARNDLWIRVGNKKSDVHAPLVHLLHHVGTTGSSAYEATAVNKELTEEFVEAARWGREAPTFIVRSHRHRSIVVSMPAEHGRAASMVTPAWQGKTPYVFKIPGGRLAEPQIGGILIRQGEETYYHQEWVRTFDRTEEE